jgi:DNA-binding response OmpR family regulator
MLIAFMLEDFIADAGHAMVGPCTTLVEAHAALDAGGFDAALVDLGLPDGSSEPVIDALAARGVPFAIMSGRSDERLAARAAGVLAKPFTFEELARTLAALAGARA